MECTLVLFISDSRVSSLWGDMAEVSMEEVVLGTEALRTIIFGAGGA